MNGAEAVPIEETAGFFGRLVSSFTPEQWSALSTIATFSAVVIALITSSIPIIQGWRREHRRKTSFRTRLALLLIRIRSITKVTIALMTVKDERYGFCDSYFVGLVEALSEYVGELYILSKGQREPITKAYIELGSFQSGKGYSKEIWTEADESVANALEAIKDATDTMTIRNYESELNESISDHV